ncbi:ABC transporter permease [Pedobacter sp. MR2016-19]|uniref:ABC transporter permease n=1 Tax=Pedobacter sp. MR2016-19 TaxID=2780089 RepID=UPI001873AB2D|nr:ABC transporter permease [Pedobacter sp. MR2016-19]MBE5319716.1 ABC transporter permease [Pedobacter sp. MR2016-19]
MHALYISLVSEFYKSRKTLAFWAAILLPIIICSLISFGFYYDAEKIIANHYPPMLLWANYSGAALGVMGFLIMPFYVIFMAFSVNNIEHKNDTWKMLFAQPLNKFSIYAAKYLYAILLIFICLFLFATLTYTFGHILQVLIPKFNFNQYNPSNILINSYAKLFLASLGILSLQFILSLLWSDFLKPMGIGFVGTIMGIITANVGWKYAYLIPYSLPTLALRITKVKKGADPLAFPVFTQEIWTSLIYASVLFIIGYFIVTKKSIK